MLTPGLCQTQFVYDGSSNLTAKVDPAGTRTTYSYNGNVLKAIEMPDGRAPRLPLGILIPRSRSSTPLAPGNVIYDAETFNLLAQTDPLGNRTTYAWDTNNNMTLVEDPRGYRTTYAYQQMADAFGGSRPFSIRTGAASPTSWIPARAGCWPWSTS